MQPILGCCEGYIYRGHAPISEICNIVVYKSMWLVLLNIFLIFAEKKEDMEQTVKYGIGQQSFEDLRSLDYLYVDKTQYIAHLLRQGIQYCFLGRPRRFGKSLLLSTLKCFFEGKRELFHGLYIDSTPWDWEEWPVIYIDFNRGSYSQNVEELEVLLDKFLSEQEARFGITAVTTAVALRFEDIIKAAHERTGKILLLGAVGHTYSLGTAS